jgi:hypothetical protein
VLGNGSVNTFPQHKRSTIGRPLLGNGLVDVRSGQQKTVFSMVSIQSGYEISSVGSQSSRERESKVRIE